MDNFTIDFIGVGARKGGTTWIADCLWEHPEICMSQPKEVNFFNELRPALFGQPNSNFNKSLRWYTQHYAHCRASNLRGEFCVNYLQDTKAAHRIHSLFPTVKIIIGLRNPVDRAYSDYNMFRYYVSSEKSVTFEDALEKNQHYLESSLYYDHVKRYIDLFGGDHVHFVFMDDIKRDPKDVVSKLFLFLDVDPNFEPQALVKKSNESKIVRFKNFGRFVFVSKRILVRMRLNAVLEFLKRTHIDQTLMKIGSKEQGFGKVNNLTRKKLVEYFKVDIEQLENLVQRDLSMWKQ